MMWEVSRLNLKIFLQLHLIFTLYLSLFIIPFPPLSSLSTKKLFCVTVGSLQKVSYLSLFSYIFRISNLLLSLFFLPKNQNSTEGRENCHSISSRLKDFGITVVWLQRDTLIIAIEKRQKILHGAGFEPPTYCLQVKRLTDWATCDCGEGCNIEGLERSLSLPPLFSSPSSFCWKNYCGSTVSTQIASQLTMHQPHI